MAKTTPAKPHRNAKVKTGVGVIYARYSSHSQKDASIEQQVAECMQHAQEIGLTIVETYADRAISGKTDRRPAFQRMMKDAEKGYFQYVVAWKSNRIGRNMLQAMVNESKLEEMGVRVLYAEEDFDDTAAGRFALRSMMNVNQFYSENMAEDIRRGLQDNASKCKSNGSLPFGLCKDEDGRVDVNEAEAEIVREIYTRVASREPFADIMADLNSRGIKTKRGARWNKGSFCTLLHNERYTGVYIYGDIRVDGGIPRIVSDELYQKVQEVCKMKKNPQNGRHRTGAEDYLLTGKLRCGHCGSFMSGTSGTSRSGELHYYYTCQGRKAKICHKKNIRRDTIEQAVAEAIMTYCLTDEVIDWIADQTMTYWEQHDNNLQIDALENELAANKKSVSNLLKAIEAGIITETTKARLLELENEQAQLNARLQAARADEVKIDRADLVASLQLLRSGDIHDKKFQAELFKTFLLCVYVYDDNRLKIMFSFTDDQASVEIPLESEETDTGEISSGESCSFKSRIAPPRHLLQSKRVFFVCAARGGREFPAGRETFPAGQTWLLCVRSRKVRANSLFPKFPARFSRGAIPWRGANGKPSALRPAAAASRAKPAAGAGQKAPAAPAPLHACASARPEKSAENSRQKDTLSPPGGQWYPEANTSRPRAA